MIVNTTSQDLAESNATPFFAPEGSVPKFIQTGGTLRDGEAFRAPGENDGGDAGIEPGSGTVTDCGQGDQTGVATFRNHTELPFRRASGSRDRGGMGCSW